MDLEDVKGKFSDILSNVVVVSFRPVRTERTEMGGVSGDFPHGYAERAVNPGQLDRHSAHIGSRVSTSIPTHYGQLQLPNGNPCPVSSNP